MFLLEHTEYTYRRAKDVLILNINEDSRTMLNQQIMARYSAYCISTRDTSLNMREYTEALGYA
jgi:hypothetical protein